MILNGVIHHDILHTEEISDHDAPYVICSIKKEKYQPRYKFIRNEKILDMNSYDGKVKHELRVTSSNP